jgi:peptidoglycan/xylan/chitin deacetylase (PgdA/CDA1 family)
MMEFLGGQIQTGGAHPLTVVRRSKPAASGLTANRRPIPILTYHQLVNTPPRGTPYREIYLSPADFARQMALLHKWGYRGLSMTALQPYLRGELEGRVVGVTFDDGYLNNFEHALPVLSQYNFSATCYIVSQLVGKTNAWDQKIGLPPAPLMGVAELRQWLALGHDIGAHTRNHVHLDRVDDACAYDEIVLAKYELESALHVPVHHFCYPYGAYRPHHVAMVHEAGYQSATTTRRGRCFSRKDMMALPRVAVPGASSNLAFYFKLVTAFEDRPYMPARLCRLMPFSDCPENHL